MKISYCLIKIVSETVLIHFIFKLTLKIVNFSLREKRNIGCELGKVRKRYSSTESNNIVITDMDCNSKLHERVKIL